MLNPFFVFNKIFLQLIFISSLLYHYLTPLASHTSTPESMINIIDPYKTKTNKLISYKKNHMTFREATIEDIPQLYTIRISVKENILPDPSIITKEDYANNNINFIVENILDSNIKDK